MVHLKHFQNFSTLKNSSSQNIVIDTTYCKKPEASYLMVKCIKYENGMKMFIKNLPLIFFNKVKDISIHEKHENKLHVLPYFFCFVFFLINIQKIFDIVCVIDLKIYAKSMLFFFFYLNSKLIQTVKISLWYKFNILYM